MATRAGRKWCDPCGVPLPAGASPYLSILVNNIELEGAALGATPAEFIIYTLATRGAIVYLRTLKEWYAFKNVGKLDRFGYPQKIRLILSGGSLGPAFEVTPEEFCIFPANAEFYAPVNEIIKRVETLNEIGLTLTQNLRNIRQCTAIFYDDEQLTKNIEDAVEDRLCGASMVKIKRGVGQNIEIENFGAAAVSFIPDLLAAWQQTMEELNAVVGVATVGEKTERRITDEIALIEDSSSAIIDLIINAINSHAARYGIDIKASRRTAATMSAEGTGTGAGPREEVEQ